MPATSNHETQCKGWKPERNANQARDRSTANNRSMTGIRDHVSHPLGQSHDWLVVTTSAPHTFEATRFSIPSVVSADGRAAEDESHEPSRMSASCRR